MAAAGAAGGQWVKAGGEARYTAQPRGIARRHRGSQRRFLLPTSLWHCTETPKCEQLMAFLFFFFSLPLDNKFVFFRVLKVDRGDFIAKR